MRNDRSHYRKNVYLTAYVIGENEEEQTFTIRNLSLGGIKAHFDGRQRPAAEQVVRLKVPELNLEGCMFPVWEKLAPEGGLDMGFEFGSLEGVGGNHYHYRDERRLGAS